MIDTARVGLRETRRQLDEVVDATSKEEIVQCARLLAIYVALYKQQYGAVTESQYQALHRQLAGDTGFGESVYLNGMRELLETLALVDNNTAPAPYAGKPTIN